MSEAFDLHWDRGWEFYEAEKFEEAIAEWQLARELDPEDGYVLNNIGRALSRLGRKEEAITQWRKAVQLEPDYDSLHVNLAYALTHQGFSLEALAAVQAAIRLKSDDAHLYNHLGFHLLVQADQNKDKDGWAAAGAAFQQALDIDSTNSYAHQYLARTQWARGKKREAIKTLKHAVQVDPNDAKAYIQLWNYQSRAWNFWGMIQTTYAIEKLPDSEALNEHYADINNLWPQTQRTLLLIVGLVAVLVGVWIWNRRRRD